MIKISAFPKTVILVLIIFSIAADANSNLLRSDKDNSLSSPAETDVQKLSEKDSLPAGVTEEWLNNLRDERGNRLNSKNESNITRENPEDPEGDAMQRKIFNGPSTSSQFGFSVSNAGDVNGDGFGDIIVGTYGYTSFTGRAYIYYGGINMNTAPDLVMTGETTSNYFGWSVSGAGDINADGYDDVIVGADGYSSDKGRAYVFFGGAVMNNTADMIMTGQSGSSRFATSVSSSGDINGDGFPDIILGELSFNSGRGRTYVYYGGISPDTIADLTITGEASLNYFGVSVSDAGDFNGDGFSDFIVGANGYSGSTGRAYIFFGGNSPDTLADVIMTGEATGNNFGYSVSSAGDVNGDGFTDVITGAYGNSSFTGKAYIYYGGFSPDNTADVTMTGETITNYFGISVSSAGDVNGDGYSDVIVGADRYSSSAGKAYIYFGGEQMNNISDVTIAGETTNSRFGVSVSSAGDVNGDGYSDVICGANGFNNGTGRVYVYDYFMKGTIVQDLVLIGENVSGFLYFGISVSSAGDVNGDGYSDVIVGAKEYSGRTGKAYIYYGGAGMDNIADVTMTGETTSNSFGTSVSSAGDVNGDGYSDVIIGASEYSTYRGRAYIYFGGVSMNNVADVIMTGDTTYNFFGTSVSSAGDLNGDGYSDVIVGASGYSSSRGRANIYFGGAVMDNVQDVNLFGESSSDEFGNSVSTAGDMNGDGYSDVIVGASGHSSTFGRAYIYFGGSPMNSGADVTLNGESPYSYFGDKVSDAGDVNGDGYFDVMVATYHPYAGNTRVYIFHGGSNVNNVPDLYFSGSNSFGRSVSSAGDINADGYSDILIGLSNSSNVGSARVYFGGAVMDSTEDISMYGDTLSSGFGGAVSAAGDINGDGYSDLIVGASTNNPKGRSYIYTGSAISAKPILNYVKDVLNDQGGNVELKWARSSYDVNGLDLITHYVVERSSPPSGGNFAWSNISEIPANKNSFYSINSPTPYDSGSNSNGMFYYRITAKTSIPSQYWRSAILFGRSIDNIAP
ncbi:MAG: FG-GAP repeat protein, partial [Bacteroidetes bacterium]|nr:FG-GAP repeat protein [Bacteroidota bacterium]